MASAKDEVSRRTARRDPRVDSIPDMPAAQAQKVSFVEKVAARVKRDPRADPDPEEAPVAPEVTDGNTPAEPERASTEPKAPEERPSAPVVDPRLADLDPLFARSAWREIAERLGAHQKAGELSPALSLIYALAQREAGGEAGASAATPLAIRSMASMLGIPATSDTALVLAKRLLRQNPVGLRKTAPAKLSVPVILLGIAVGAAVGWFMSLGSFKLF